jgi:hypothetical protein
MPFFKNSWSSAWSVLWGVIVIAGCSDIPRFTGFDAGMLDGGGGLDGASGSGGSGGSGGDNDAMASDQDSGSDDAAIVIDSGAPDSGDASDAATCQPPLFAMHDSLGGAHVVTNDGVVYNSNPPSSGPHCGNWGQYAIFGDAKPLPRCNYIHNLEHGAVVLLYKCDVACPDVVAALTAVRDTIIDAQCPSAKRVIITPDANIDTPIAATAWQNTWTSHCVNQSAMDSLSAFIVDNLGSAGLATESGVCGDGSVAP